MNEQIMVTQNQNGQLAALDQTQLFALYQNSHEGWRQCDVYAWPQMRSAVSIRDAINDLANRFNNCRIVVSQKISGIAFQTLDKLGFDIIESQTVSDAFFEDVIKEMSMPHDDEQDIPREPVSPQDDGHYFFDLIKLQKAYPDISSKKALKDFMEQKTFMSLELVCSHLPPWMEAVMSQRGLGYSVQPKDASACKVLIVKNRCK
jgi:Fe-only nitrogenase accessory protein AnfO